MDFQSVGRILLIFGIVVAILGGLLMIFGQSSLLSKLGNLPGDVRIEGQGFSCFIPIGSMFIISLFLTIIINVVVRLINRP
jgi:hypothetical protein